MGGHHLGFSLFVPYIGPSQQSVIYVDGVRTRDILVFKTGGPGRPSSQR